MTRTAAEKVWILMVAVEAETSGLNMPRLMESYKPIPFYTQEKMERHILELIAKNLMCLREQERKEIIPYLEAKNFPEAILCWRNAYFSHIGTFTIHMYWDTKPEAIL